jgi:hypothetical protein
MDFTVCGSMSIARVDAMPNLFKGPRDFCVHCGAMHRRWVEGDASAATRGERYVVLHSMAAPVASELVCLPKAKPAALAVPTVPRRRRLGMLLVESVPIGAPLRSAVTSPLALVPAASVSSAVGSLQRPTAAAPAATTAMKLRLQPILRRYPTPIGAPVRTAMTSALALVHASPLTTSSFDLVPAADVSSARRPLPRPRRPLPRPKAGAAAAATGRRHLLRCRPPAASLATGAPECDPLPSALALWQTPPVASAAGSLPIPKPVAPAPCTASTQRCLRMRAVQLHPVGCPVKAACTSAPELVPAGPVAFEADSCPRATPANFPVLLAILDRRLRTLGLIKSPLCSAKPSALAMVPAVRGDSASQSSPTLSLEMLPRRLRFRRLIGPPLRTAMPSGLALVPVAPGRSTARAIVPPVSVAPSSATTASPAGQAALKRVATSPASGARFVMLRHGGNSGTTTSISAAAHAVDVADAEPTPSSTPNLL